MIATSGRTARRKRRPASRKRWKAPTRRSTSCATRRSIKAIGFGINEADTCVKFAKAGDFDVAMMAGRYTLIDQTGLAEFLPLALEKNMGVMLAGVFNSGILATGSGTGAKFDYTDAPKAVVDKVKAIEEICKKHKVTLRQAAIQFALGHPAVVSVVLAR